MLAAEVARLERLMSARAPSDHRDFSIDEVVEPLVVSHQARGRDVRWDRCGLTAFGDADDLAEVVNILLENAARHGGSGPVRLTAVPDGDHVEITCCDSGPGVSPDVRADLFTSGVRRSDSPGQGFGLAIARRLMTEGGGSLELADGVAPGATFIVRLTRMDGSRVAASNVA